MRYLFLNLSWALGLFFSTNYYPKRKKKSLDYIKLYPLNADAFNRASVEMQKVKCFLIFSNICSDPLVISLSIDITQTNCHCQF